MKTALRLSAATALCMSLTACGGDTPSFPGLVLVPTNTTPAPLAPLSALPDQGVVGGRRGVIGYGDSILAGNGTEITPMQVLQSMRPAYRIVDRARAGTRLDTLAAKFDAEDLAGGDVVVIENGVIDSWFDAPIGQFLSHIDNIVSRIRVEGRIPVITGFSRQVPGMLDGAALALRDYFDLALKLECAALKVVFADWGAVPFGGAEELLDGVHPAKAYSDRLVDRLASAIDQSLAWGK